MKKLLLFLVILLSASQVWAECGTVNRSLAMDLPTASYAGSLYHVTFSRWHNPADSASFYLKLNTVESATAMNSCAMVDEQTLGITVYCAEFAGQKYKLELELYKIQENQFYWRLVNVDRAATGGAHPPVADPVSFATNPATPYAHYQLSGHDPDNDIITYELVSPSSGSNYSAAYINPNSGMLYITLVPGARSFGLTYRVTDGLQYSNPATISIEVSTQQATTRGTGAEDIAPEIYAGFQMSNYNSDLLGAPNTDATRPTSIDLSANFPLPGDQGRQNSCVGWAVAYALKSFQEKVEIDWELNDISHLFSPAFIYNQVNGGRDGGTTFDKALDLVVNRGVATLDMMPYSVDDYLTQPSPQAMTEASFFVARRWAKINDSSQIISALVNRQPVLCAIRIFQSFNNIKGPDSVYNTKDGPVLGGHAVTIVGYDDNKFGGAYKIINSYGQDWGDRGYFWLPYSFAADDVLFQAFILEDRENAPEAIPAPVTPTVTEPVDSQLPNLVVSSWYIPSYDPRPRGQGTLMYEVTNTGAGTAPAGADVNLILSPNPEITTNDYYVIYETIPFELKSGETVYRDQSNALTFRLPDQLPPGMYYIALWVDDLDVVQESDENDNISMGDGMVTVENHLPDLMVNSWYAEWDASGYGQLTYEVINNGASATTNTRWDINLILDLDQRVGNGNEIYLFYETAAYLLNPGEYLYRDESSPAFFSIYSDYSGRKVPPGVYYIGLWVDDLNLVEESNEVNNGSYSWGKVPVADVAATRSTSSSLTVPGGQRPGAAYNGRHLPPANLVIRKVEITRSKSGLPGMRFINDDKTTVPASKASMNSRICTKKISSKTSLIFPTGRRLPMDVEH